MLVFNWVRARFDDGDDFVSDAPDDVASEIARALSEPADDGTRSPGFGARLLGSRPLVVVYLRHRADGPRLVDPAFAHAVAYEASEAPAPARVEALFRAHYGEDVAARVEALAGSVETLPVRGAAASLTDLFIHEEELQMWQRSRTSEAGRSPVVASRDLLVPWLVASVAIAAAGFLAGRTLTRDPGLPSVGSAPPELATRVEALEADLGHSSAALREQLEYERRRHAEELAEKQQEIDELARRLESRGERVDRPVASAPAPAELAPVDVFESAPSPQAAALRLAEVQSARLRVRSGPGRRHPVVSLLVEGDRVVAVEEQDGWVRIEAPLPGWVASEFLEALP